MDFRHLLGWTFLVPFLRSISGCGLDQLWWYCGWLRNPVRITQRNQGCNHGCNHDLLVFTLGNLILFGGTPKMSADGTKNESPIGWPDGLFVDIC